MRKKKRGGSIEYWVRAIEKAREQGEKTAQALAVFWKTLLRDVRAHLQDIIAGGEVYLLDLLGSTPAATGYRAAGNRVYYGVDSSVTRPVRVGVKYLAFYSAAAVRVVPGNPPVSSVADLYVDAQPVPDVGDLSSYKKELTLNMFTLEHKALQKAFELAERGDAILLDGPLIDPPNFLRSLSYNESLWNQARTLVEARATLLARAIDEGLNIAGYVKRLQGSIFLDPYLGDKAELYRNEVGDRLLALSIARVVLEEAEKWGLCQEHGRIVVVTRPVEMEERWASDTPLYVETMRDILGRDVRIYTSLYVPLYCDGNRRRPARIEFIAEPGRQDEVALQIAGMLEAVSVPGPYLPLPVLLAHKACTIRRREGLKLLAEAASWHAVEVLNMNAPSLVELFS